MLPIVERILSFLTSSRKGYDVQLFTRQPLFKDISPTITVSSSLGPSPLDLPQEYISAGASSPAPVPPLTWTLSSTIPTTSISSLLFICEDPDAPIGCILHSAVFEIPPEVTKLDNEDLEKAAEGKLKNGWRYAKNLRSKVYIAPQPLLGHGVHRYFYTIVALGKGEDEVVLNELPTKEDVVKLCERRGVLGWGEWIGNAQRD